VTYLWQVLKVEIHFSSNTHKLVAFVSMFAIRWHRSCKKLDDRGELRWFVSEVRPNHTG